jgi:phosphoglycolate phosphatase
MVPPTDTYDFWLFDLDGTVVDAEWSYTRETFDRVGERLGRSFTDREAEVIWHGLGGARDRQLREWGIDPEEFWPAFHAVEDPAARAEATYLHDDAARLLRRVEGPVGVVTHCQAFLADPVLDRLDLRDWFDTVLCCTTETGWKPDPAPVRRAMADLGVLDPDAGSRPGAGDAAPDGGSATGRGVFVGDGASDVGAAWNAGLDAVHVERHDPTRRGQCVLGDRRVRSLDELLPE